MAQFYYDQKTNTIRSKAYPKYALQPDQNGEGSKLVLSLADGAWSQRFSFDNNKMIHHLTGRAVVVDSTVGV